MNTGTQVWYVNDQGHIDFTATGIVLDTCPIDPDGVAHPELAWVDFDGDPDLFSVDNLLPVSN